MMILLVLLTDQPPDFLHLLIVLPDACLVTVLDLHHSLGLLLLASGVGLGCVVDGRLRFVFCLGVQGGVCADLAGVGEAVVAKSGLQHLPLFLFLQKLLPSPIAKGYQPMDPFSLRLFSIPFLLPLQQRLLELGVLIIIGMVKLVHLVGGTMRIVPNKPLRLVKLPILEELPGLWERWMWQNGLEVVILDGGLAGVLHLSIKLSSEVITNKGSDEIKGEVLAEPEVFVLEKAGALGHLLLNGKVDQLFHYFLFPLAGASVFLGDQDGLYEVLLLGYDRVDLFLAPEVVLYGFFGDGQPGLDEILIEALIVEIDEHCFLFVGDQSYKFFQSFREGAFLALVVIGKVRVEIERFLLLGHEKVQNFNQDLTYLWIQLYVIF